MSTMPKPIADQIVKLKKAIVAAHGQKFYDALKDNKFPPSQVARILKDPEAKIR